MGEAGRERGSLTRAVSNLTDAVKDLAATQRAFHIQVENNTRTLQSVVSALTLLHQGPQPPAGEGLTLGQQQQEFDEAWTQAQEESVASVERRRQVYPHSDTPMDRTTSPELGRSSSGHRSRPESATEVPRPQSSGRPSPRRSPPRHGGRGRHQEERYVAPVRRYPRHDNYRRDYRN